MGSACVGVDKGEKVQKMGQDSSEGSRTSVRNVG